MITRILITNKKKLILDGNIIGFIGVAFNS